MPLVAQPEANRQLAAKKIERLVAPSAAAQSGVCSSAWPTIRCVSAQLGRGPRTTVRFQQLPCVALDIDLVHSHGVMLLFCAREPPRTSVDTYQDSKFASYGMPIASLRWWIVRPSRPQVITEGSRIGSHVRHAILHCKCLLLLGFCCKTLVESIRNP